MKFFAFIILFLYGLHGYSQNVNQDTINVEQPNRNEPYGVFDIFDGNPGKSALYSLIFPGAGQFYNKRYWKVPIVLGIEGTAVVILIDNIQKYNESNTYWKELVSGERTDINGVPITASEYKPFRDNDRQNMEWAYLALGVIHLINIADAFVDRHLIEFDVEDDISFNVRPSRYSAGIAVVLKF